MFGSLFLLGESYARNRPKPMKSYGDVFQVRLSNRAFTSSEIFNSRAQNQADWVLESCLCELHQSLAALISRPTFWAFPDVVSETQGVYTLGTSLWND
jgi:phenylacetate 2-hydroxylase